MSGGCGRWWEWVKRLVGGLGREWNCGEGSRGGWLVVCLLSGSTGVVRFRGPSAMDCIPCLRRKHHEDNKFGNNKVVNHSGNSSLFGAFSLMCTVYFDTTRSLQRVMFCESLENIRN